MAELRQTGDLTPARFIAKWQAVDLSERAASQEHFIDLCNLLQVAELQPAWRVLSLTLRATSWLHADVPGTLVHCACWSYAAVYRLRG